MNRKKTGVDQVGDAVQLAQLCGGFSKMIIMIEKIAVSGRDVWVTIEAVEAQKGVIPTEYFVGYYSLHEPAVEASTHEPGKEPGRLFEDEDGSAKRFLSPVEVVEYAVEVLPGVIGR